VLDGTALLLLPPPLLPALMLPSLMRLRTWLRPSEQP
jgi:hypothetical protein